MLTGYSGSAVNLTVPATLNGKAVIGVEGSVGRWPSTLVNLDLPEGLKFIGQAAFSGMKKLVNVSLPGSLEHIYDHAFNDCEKITSISFGPNLRTLGDAFAGSGVTGFDLPATLERLGRKLPSITIDPANPHFSKVDGALYNEDTKTLLWAWGSEIPTSFTVKDGTKRIGESAFFEIAALEQLTLPASVAEIDTCAFEGCSELKTATLNEGLERIGAFAFNGCGKLTSLELPSTLVELEYGALRYTGITDLMIPTGLFADPGERWILKAMIKEDMEALRWIETAPEHPLYEGDGGLLYEKGTHTLLYVPRAINWPPSVRTNTRVIGEGAFENCASIPAIYLPEGVTTIGNDALSGTTIQGLTFPDGVASIGYQENLSKLEWVTIPASVTELGHFAASGFSSDEKRTKVYGVTGTAAQELAEAQGWEFVSIGTSGITQFDLRADGVRVTSLTMWQGDVVEVVAENQGTDPDAVVWDFGDDDNRLAAQVLSRRGRVLLLGGGAPGTSTYTVRAADDPTVTCELKVTVKALGAGTPSCAVLPAGLKAVESNAFRGTKFKYISIPDGVTSIESRAFMNCSNLRVVRIPDSVTFIAKDAFDGCSDVVVVYGSSVYITNRLHGDAHIVGMISWKERYIWLAPWQVS